MAKNSSFRRYTNISVLMALAFLLTLIVGSIVVYEPQSSSQAGGQAESGEGGGG